VIFPLAGLMAFITSVLVFYQLINLEPATNVAVEAI
jgi:hypothetical protein